MEKDNKNNSIGFLGLLTIVFITLKLLKVITWSWFWVLSPIIIPSIFIIFLFLVLGICQFIVLKRSKNNE